MACWGGERFRERSQLCERQNSIAQDAAAASVGASVLEAASLPLSLFCLPSTQLESAHAPAPQEELLLQHMVAGWSVEERLCLGHWTLIWPRRRTPWSQTC